MSVSMLSKPVNLERIIICLAFLERRVKLMSDAIFEPAQNLFVPGQTNEFDSINDDIYFAMLDAKNHLDFTRQPWYMKFVKSNELVKDIEGKNAKNRIK